MSIMKVTRSYEYNSICDVCGFKFKNYELKKRWDGFMVCKHDYEMRHPMDFYTTRNDVHQLPWTRSDSNGVDIGPLSNSVNWAAASNGATATASSEASGFLATYANDGDFRDKIGGASKYWNSWPAYAFPEWLQIDFGQTRRIHTVIVTGRQLSINSELPAPEGDLGTRALKDFQIQCWDDKSGWVNVVNIYNNALTKTTHSFGFRDTSKIRIFVTSTVDGVYARIVEVEAYGILGGVDATAVAGRAISGIAISGRE